MKRKSLVQILLIFSFANMFKKRQKTLIKFDLGSVSVEIKIIHIPFVHSPDRVWLGFTFQLELDPLRLCLINTYHNIT